MRRRIQFALCVALMLPPPAPAAGGRAQDNKPGAGTPTAPVFSRIQPPPAGYRFPHGQTLVYSVEWRFFTAGTTTLRMDPDGERQRISVAADSSGFVNMLYGVHDHFQSSFHPRSFCSLEVFKQTSEGSRKKESRLKFDYARSKSVLEEKDIKKGSSKRVENDIPACVTDVISGIYYLGSLPLQVGTTYSFPLNDGGKTVEVKAHVEAREQIKTGAGTFQTLRVQPAAASDARYKGKFWVWYSDDAARIPVQMRARAGWGGLTFRLLRMEKQEVKAAQAAD